MITIIDYNLGNIGSLVNMFKKIGAEVQVASDISKIKDAKKLVLPGVGAFDNGMNSLLPFIPVLEEKVLKEKTPILGICLGMQLFSKKSQEGKLKGLGWLEAETVRFKVGDLKIPHMGWNVVVPQKKDTIFKNMDGEIRFYFVHSYHLVCPQENILGKTNYGYDFVSAVEKENIFGVQFHPEKSHKFGIKLLENFINLC